MIRSFPFFAWGAHETKLGISIWDPHDPVGLSFSELGPVPHAATVTDREEVWLDALPYSNLSGERRGEGGGVQKYHHF